jgi:sugar phosphate isomerase/epimerase
MNMTRREWMAASGAAVAAAAQPPRIPGIACNIGIEESQARKTLAAARAAGFRSIQIQFAWDAATPAFLGALPGWVRSEGLETAALGAYVNCAAPANVLMNCRAEDIARAVDFAGALGARVIVAWTGGFGKGLMTSDPRNTAPGASDHIVRFLEPFLPKLERAGLRLALESYITLVCPDAVSLGALLNRLPRSVGAVLDPPNLTPVAMYARRDEALRAMCRSLEGRVVLVHLKDFRLAAGGNSYDLPGPLDGEMNYPLYIEQIRKLPAAVPVVAEHLGPERFAEAHRRLSAAFGV